MAVKTQVDAILNKQMDRKDFLKHVAIGVVALSGIGSALKLLSSKQQTTKSVDNGYGGSAYGGIKAEK